MEIVAPAAALAFLAAPLILVLYILKVKGGDARVASLVLWPRHLADRQADTPWKRLRSSLLLVAQLLVAAVLAIALMRPELVGAAGAAKTTVVLLDGSPSMQATDVAPSRFGAAVAHARRLAGQLGKGREMAVAVLGGQPHLLVAPTNDPAQLRDALDRARPAAQTADLDAGLSLARAVIAGRPGGEVIMIGDGHTKPPAPGALLRAPFRFEAVGGSSANAALEALGRTAEGEVFLRVANHGTSAVDRRVELRADGELVDVVPVRVEPGSSAEPRWSRLPPQTKILEARLTPGDYLALDDSAWLVTEPAARRRVLLVTEGNGFLTRALSLREDVDVTVVAPSELKRSEDYDLFVFDRFVPEGPLPAPALVVGPPEGKGPVAAGKALDPGGVLPADPRDPLLEHVSLRDVHVQSASVVAPPAGWRTVVAAVNGPLLLVHQGEPRLAQLTFDLHQSDLPLRAAFPVLVQNLLTYLLPGGFENHVLPLGQPVSLAGGPNIESLDVTLPSGRHLRLVPPFPAVLEDTSSPGVYTVAEKGRAETSTRRFVVQLSDSTQSRIAPRPSPVVRTAQQPAGEVPRRAREIWPWMVLAAMVGLGVEWLLFLRG